MSVLPFYGEFNRTHLVLKGNAHGVSLRLFNAEASMPRRCHSLFVKHQTGTVKAVEVRHVHDEFDRMFIQGIRSGRLDYAEQVHLSPEFALGLFLVPLFAPNRLLWSDVRPDRIDVKNMVIGDRALTLRVFPDAEQDVVMVDAYGVPLGV